MQLHVSTGELMIMVLAGVATFERHLIQVRTSEGRARAVANGVKLGPKRKLSPATASPKSWIIRWIHASSSILVDHRGSGLKKRTALLRRQLRIIAQQMYRTRVY